MKDALQFADEWKRALKLLDTYLGLARHKLSPYVVHVYPDVREVET